MYTLNYLKTNRNTQAFRPVTNIDRMNSEIVPRIYPENHCKIPRKLVSGQ